MRRFSRLQRGCAVGLLVSACALPGVDIVDQLHGGTSGGSGGAGGSAGGAGASSSGVSGMASPDGGAPIDGGAPNQSGSSGTAGGGKTNTGGTAGSVGDGGKAGTAGQSGGDFGGAGSPADGGDGPGEPPDLTPVAAALDGLTMLAPCKTNLSTRECVPITAAACATNADPVLTGGIMFDKSVTMGGDAGTTYEVTLHLQGIVEARNYTGGTDADSSGTQIPANGWYEGGQPVTPGNYNTMAIRVASPAADYFLNSVGVGTDNRVRHSSFLVDYTATIVVKGGSSVRLVMVDPNCAMMKNCTDPSGDTVCNAVPIPDLDAEIASKVGTMPYNGQFIGMRVVSVTAR